MMDDAYWEILPQPLTVPSISTFLRVTETTVLRRLQDGTIPGHHIGRSWIVFQCEFREWIASTRNIPLPQTDKCDPLQSFGDQLVVADLMKLFGKTDQTIANWLAAGYIPGYKPLGVWSVDKNELRASLTENSNQKLIS